MRKRILLLAGMVLALTLVSWQGSAAPATNPIPKMPRFSIQYMDKSVNPGSNFFLYANGTWIKTNPVPANKSRWNAFGELQERNWALINQILQTSATGIVLYGTTEQKVADFYRSAMDTNRLEMLGFAPLNGDRQRIQGLKTVEEMLELVADFHEKGVHALFGRDVRPDARKSDIYAFDIRQGGLGLPDREYYLSDKFAKEKEAYVAHIARMLSLAGESDGSAKTNAAMILEIETALAKASKPRVDLRDPIANYHRFVVADLPAQFPRLPLPAYLRRCGLERVPVILAGQPEFLKGLEALIKERPLDQWKAYLRWHLIDSAAPYMHSAVEEEWFAFHGKILSGQAEPEPRWQRAAKTIDAQIGEALGQLFVEEYFPAAARIRMRELVANVKAVFRDRLKNLEWMTEPTRAKALAKFEKFTEKIGHPDKFRDYSAVEIRAKEYLGNVQRAEVFESRRQLARVGLPVDRAEWHMTPETVNAYFNPSQNEIVFPAGILQPPFFDMEMDDAVNYGAIGVVIGHEITHGYDDQGRKYNADGNLVDWWTDADAKAFDARSQLLVNQYDTYEALPGVKVNGKLTLGENIADLGGTTIAYEALQRALAKDPSKRKEIDGLTPEQRFFLSLAQIWRINCREAEIRRLVTIDPHSPGEFRGMGPHVNLPEFYAAFGIKEGVPMWRAPELRAKIW